MFHGILHVKVHVHKLRETWSTQTRDVNLDYLCRVSLRVLACKSEVINEQYCISLSFNIGYNIKYHKNQYQRDYYNTRNMILSLSTLVLNSRD